MIDRSTRRIEIFDLVPKKVTGRGCIVDMDSKTVHAEGSLKCLLDMSKCFAQFDSHLVGVVSSTTLIKAGISIEALSRFLVGRPKYSVYFVNTAAASEVFFENVWVRALFLQKHVVKDLPPLLAAFDLDANRVNRFAGDESWLSFNNLVATPKFWKAFHFHLEKGLEKFLSCSQVGQSQQALAIQPQSEGMFTEIAMFSIFADPLLTEFFSLYPDEFKTLRIRSARLESMLDGHCRKLLELRKIVAETKREDIYQGWLGYRNLYLESRFGTEYLTNILNIKNGINPFFDH